MYSFVRGAYRLPDLRKSGFFLTGSSNKEAAGGDRIGSDAGQHAYERRQGRGGGRIPKQGGQIASGERDCPICTENRLVIQAYFRESAAVLGIPN